MSESNKHAYNTIPLNVLSDGKVIFICHQQGNVIVQRPYKLWTDQIPSIGKLSSSVTLARKTDQGDAIKVKDAVNGDIKHIKKTTILWVQCHFIDDVEQNISHFNEWLSPRKDALAASDSHDSTLSREEREMILFSTSTEIFNAARLFGFNIQPDKITSNTLTEEEMRIAKEHWLNIIRDYRMLSLIELDELEKDVSDQPDSTPEDITDIQTIKQMFRDIPQEINLDTHKTFRELVRDWPALLLPYPANLEDLKELTESPASPDFLQPEFDHNMPLEIMASHIDSIDDLRQLYNEVKDIDSVPKPAKDILRNRIKELT